MHRNRMLAVEPRERSIASLLSWLRRRWVLAVLLLVGAVAVLLLTAAVLWQKPPPVQKPANSLFKDRWVPGGPKAPKTAR